MLEPNDASALKQYEEFMVNEIVLRTGGGDQADAPRSQKLRFRIIPFRYIRRTDGKWKARPSEECDN
jgi:hypothetical protein